MRISNRMKRYERCIIKEGDLDLMREDLKIGGRVPRVPSRVVMNNRTLTVFENDQYESALFSVILRDVKVMEYLKDKEECLVVVDSR